MPSVVIIGLNGTGPRRKEFGPQKYQDYQTFNIFQHFNWLDCAHTPNAFGPWSLGSSVLQRVPAVGPPTDARSVGGAALYSPCYFKRSALWTELAQGVKNLDAERKIRIIKFSKTFNILQHFNQLDLAHAPNAFGPWSLGSSVLQRVPGFGPPTDARSVGGAALYPPCYFKRPALWTELAQGVKNLDAERKIRIIKFSKTFNILQHFNQLGLAHAPNAFGPWSLGSSVLQRAPAAGPPSDARSAGGAALVFLCLLLTLQNPKSEGFGGGMATLPKMGMGQKLRSVPYLTCWKRRGSNTKISRKPHMLVIVYICLYMLVCFYQPFHFKCAALWSLGWTELAHGEKNLACRNTSSTAQGGGGSFKDRTL